MSGWTHVDGLSELDNKFNKLLNDMGKVNAKAFTDVTLDLLGKSVDLAPVDSGDLRGSGSVQINGKVVAQGTDQGGITVVGSAPADNAQLSAMIGFEEPYAIKQHEHTEYNHPQGGQAKYLEEPYRQNIDNYINHIANAIRQSIP